jgi:hypothetical protein
MLDSIFFALVKPLIKSVILFCGINLIISGYQKFILTGFIFIYQEDLHAITFVQNIYKWPMC